MRQEGMRLKLAVASGSASFPFFFQMSSRLHCLRVKLSTFHVTSSSHPNRGASLPQQCVYSIFQFHVSMCFFFFFQF